MNQNTSSYKLTDYQKAMLTHMGITPWVKKSASLADDVSSTGDAKPPQNNHATETKAASQGDKLAGLQKLKQQIAEPKSQPQPVQPQPIQTAGQQPKDAAQAVVLCMHDALKQHHMVQDVLQCLGLEQSNIITTEEPLATYRNFSFAWQFGNEVSFAKNVLMTPKLEQLTQAEIKKRLWQQISAQQ